MEAEAKSQTERVLILGASSAIAEACARIYAARGARLFLVARKRDRLEAIAADLKVRGAPGVGIFEADLDEDRRHGEILRAALGDLGGFDVALLAYGMLPDQTVCERDAGASAKTLQTNFTSTALLLHALAEIFEKQRAGTIAVITSVAGERGRRRNYVYSSAKAGLNVFCAGLRARLYASGAHLVTIKPGYVDTPMTAHLRKHFLFASPESVARGIDRAIRAKKDVVFLPWYWRWIAVAIRSLPERVAKRLAY